MERDYESYMKEALEEAKKAFDKDEVPIGAVVVKDGEIIGRGHNLRESSQNPIHHAEIIAIEEAAKTLGSWRLTGSEIYVTIEPCSMCAGAMVQARLERVIFGARDPKAGAVKTLHNLVEDPRFNHQLDIVEGILEDESRDIIREFFQAKR